MATDQEILEKAIQQAIDGGYDKSLGQSALNMLPALFSGNDDARDLWLRGFTFSHDFAKALWPGQSSPADYWVGIAPAHTEPVQFWQSHLQQMVIAPDPIKYLGENI